jgi:hypothetical protein
MRLLLCSLIIGEQLLSSPAYSHSWYDGTCCAETDCRPVTAGEVELRQDGWIVVPTGEILRWGNIKLKQSLDPLMHRAASIPTDGHAVYT